MKKIYFIAALTLGVAALQPALAQKTQEALVGISNSDSDRLAKIIQANMAEIDAGNLALKKSKNAKVKAFARTMVTDHTKGLNEAKKIALAKQMNLPKEASAEDRNKAEDLQKLSGADFDRAYIRNAGVADHSKVLAALKDDQAEAQDPDIRNLAKKLEPTVAHHAAMADKLNAAVK